MHPKQKTNEPSSQTYTPENPLPRLQVSHILSFPYSKPRTPLQPKPTPHTSASDTTNSRPNTNSLASQIQTPILLSITPVHRNFPHDFLIFNNYGVPATPDSSKISKLSILRFCLDNCVLNNKLNTEMMKGVFCNTQACMIEFVSFRVLYNLPKILAYMQMTFWEY